MANEAAYQLYLQRFDRAKDNPDAGDHPTSDGQALKKLSPEEFEREWSDFVALRSLFESAFERGQTLDSAVLRELRQRAAQLVVQLPAEFK